MTYTSTREYNSKVNAKAAIMKNRVTSGIAGVLIGALLCFGVLTKFSLRFFEKQEHVVSVKGSFDENAGLFMPDISPAGGKSTVEYQKEYSSNNHAVYFSKEKIDMLYERAGGASACKGFRIYRTFNQDPALKVGANLNIEVPLQAVGMLMVGVDKDGNDLVSQFNSGTQNSERILISYEKCPDNCDKLKSVLDNPER